MAQYYSTVSVNCEFAEPTSGRTKMILPESCWVSMIVRNRKPGPPESDSCVPPLPDSKLAIVPPNKAPRLTRSRGASPADHRSHGLRQLCAERAIRPVSSEQQHATRFEIRQAAPRRSRRPAATGPRHCVTLRGGCWKTRGACRVGHAKKHHSPSARRHARKHHSPSARACR